MHASNFTKQIVLQSFIGDFSKISFRFLLNCNNIIASGGILILLTKSWNDKKIKVANITDKQLRDYVAHITVNAVEEDVRRQYLIRTKRSQKKDKECKEQTDQTQFKSFVNGFLLHWEERVTKIKRLKEDYVSAC